MNKRKLDKTFESSIFVIVLKKISDFFHSKICSSRSAQLFTSYDNTEGKYSDSFTAKITARIKPSKRRIIETKNAFAAKVENSFFYTSLKRLTAVLLGAKMRAYGAVAFIVGFCAVGFGLIGYLLDQSDSSQMSLFQQGILAIVLSVPLMLSKATLCDSLANGRIGSLIVRFIGIKSDDLIKKPTGENMAVSLLIGIILGALTPVLQPIYILVFVLGLVYVGIVFHKPEFSLIVTAATLPFLPTMVIAGEIILTLIAYLLKVARGKRTLKLDFLDGFVFCFLVFMLLGGIFSVTPSKSIAPACVFVCFLAVYFLLVNLIKTKQLLKKLLYSVSFSCLLCSLYGIYQNFFAAPDTTWTDEDMFSEIETRVVSTFENPNVFGEYLIMLIPIIITLIVVSKSFSGRSLSFVTLVSAGMALVYTWSRGAWLGCIASLLIYFVIVNKTAIGLYFLGLLALPISFPFLPESITSRFTSIGNMTDSSTSYRVFIWEASTDMIKDFFVSGIGIGTHAFQTVYSEYALAGIETAPHSHNLYLQLLIELGIFGFAVFVITFFLFFAKLFTFLKNSSSREAKMLVGAFLCGIIAILIQGLTDYVWYNYRVFAFFWIMVGTAVCTVNIYKNQEAQQINSQGGLYEK